MRNARTPSNCYFVTPKRTNKEIFGNFSGSRRTIDNEIQEMQRVQTASVTMLLKAASEISVIINTEGERGRAEPQTPMNSLEESYHLLLKPTRLLINREGK